MYQNKGLTLIELMVVIATVTILASFAIPSFESIVRRQQASGEANALFSLLYLARSEAIKRNKVVTICKSGNKVECGGDWTDGWIVFEDMDTDGVKDSGETVISSGKIAENYLLSWAAFGSNNYIRFTVSGLTFAQNGTFKLCPADGDIRFARTVVISKTARVRLPKDNNGDGIFDDANGNAISCS